MTTFIDTSAFLAVLDADDLHHEKAKEAWKELVASDTKLISTNYVSVETCAVAQNRLGVKAVRTFQEDISPIVTMDWIDEVAHRAGMTGLLTAARKRLSLVDCVSFDCMRRLGAKKAFVFDRHFKEQGFECLP